MRFLTDLPRNRGLLGRSRPAGQSTIHQENREFLGRSRATCKETCQYLCTTCLECPRDAALAAAERPVPGALRNAGHPEEAGQRQPVTG